MEPKKPIVTPIFIPYSTHEKCVNVIVGIVHTPSKYGNLHLNGGLKYLTKYTIFNSGWLSGNFSVGHNIFLLNKSVSCV